jgi:hypothetical protein
MKGSLHFGCWGIVTVMPEAFAAAWRPSTRHLVPWDSARIAWNYSGGACQSMVSSRVADAGRVLTPSVEFAAE